MEIIKGPGSTINVDEYEDMDVVLSFEYSQNTGEVRSRWF